MLVAPARIFQGAAPSLVGLVLDRGAPLAALALSGTMTSASFLALLALRTGQRKGQCRAQGSGVTFPPLWVKNEQI
jgi:hypothetical protein